VRGFDEGPFGDGPQRRPFRRDDVPPLLSDNAVWLILLAAVIGVFAFMCWSAVGFIYAALKLLGVLT
jgi:hypothetical protein